MAQKSTLLGLFMELDLAVAIGTPARTVRIRGLGARLVVRPEFDLDRTAFNRLAFLLLQQLSRSFSVVVRYQFDRCEKERSGLDCEVGGVSKLEEDTLNTIPNHTSVPLWFSAPLTRYGLEDENTQPEWDFPSVYGVPRTQ